jgi:hypothetical protein
MHFPLNLRAEKATTLHEIASGLQDLERWHILDRLARTHGYTRGGNTSNLGLAPYTTAIKKHDGAAAASINSLSSIKCRLLN